MIPISEILSAIRIGTALVDAGAKALEAANNGNEVEAREILAEARSRYDSAREGWDRA